MKLKPNNIGKRSYATQVLFAEMGLTDRPLVRWYMGVYFSNQIDTRFLRRHGRGTI